MVVSLLLLLALPIIARLVYGFGGLLLGSVVFSLEAIGERKESVTGETADAYAVRIESEKNQQILDGTLTIVPTSRHRDYSEEEMYVSEDREIALFGEKKYRELQACYRERKERDSFLEARAEERAADKRAFLDRFERK
jgi:hypothetical protein